MALISGKKILIFIIIVSLFTDITTTTQQQLQQNKNENVKLYNRISYLNWFYYLFALNKQTKPESLLSSLVLILSSSYALLVESRVSGGGGFFLKFTDLLCVFVCVCVCFVVETKLTLQPVLFMWVV